MTPEELLQPRWKVIADYPGSPFKINTILKEFKYMGECMVEVDFDWYVSPIEYPAIFKKLEWWEDRDIQDLPKYVKCTGLPSYYDFLITAYIKSNQIVKCEHTGHGEIIHMNTYFEIKYFLPSSEEEYIKQTN